MRQPGNALLEIFNKTGFVELLVTNMPLCVGLCKKHKDDDQDDEEQVDEEDEEVDEQDDEELAEEDDSGTKTSTSSKGDSDSEA